MKYIIKKPVIGITLFRKYEDNGRNCYNKIGCDYTNAIVSAGGIPVPVPVLKDKKEAEYYIELIDGLLLTGGEDINPSCYGEEPIKELKSFDINRDRWEIELFKKSYEQNLPVLGICRGMQLMNVALGGTLYQDIEKQYDKNKIHLSDRNVECIYHVIKIDSDSKLYNILCETDKYRVNSYHHQAIKKLSPQIRIAAESDGVIEAIESKNKKFIIGVQWHPEELVGNKTCFHYLFNNLVAEAEKKH